MRGLYAIVDAEVLEARGLELIPFARAVVEARPAALQLRDKRASARASLASLRGVVETARGSGVPVFANDRPDLAVLAGCHGVHLGQDDVPVEVARAAASVRGAEAVPPLGIGLSTHDLGDVERAPYDALAYLAIGPVFATSSKRDTAPVLGLHGLARLLAAVRRRRSDLPVVAIGGIDEGRARDVGALADACAVIGALLPEPGAARPYAEVQRRAEALHRAVIEAAPGPRGPTTSAGGPT
jgi:thiamine-phosphate pyrophosphorylase